MATTKEKIKLSDASVGMCVKFWGSRAQNTVIITIFVTRMPKRDWKLP